MAFDKYNILIFDRLHALFNRENSFTMKPQIRPKMH